MFGQIRTSQNLRGNSVNEVSFFNIKMREIFIGRFLTMLQAMGMVNLSISPQVGAIEFVQTFERCNSRSGIIFV